MRIRTLEKGSPDAAIAIAGQHGYAELGMVVVTRQMGDANEAQLVVENAEKRIVLEINTFDISADCRVALAGPESQASVIAFKGQKMVRNPRLIET